MTNPTQTPPISPEADTQSIKPKRTRAIPDDVKLNKEAKATLKTQQRLVLSAVDKSAIHIRDRYTEIIIPISTKISGSHYYRARLRFTKNESKQAEKAKKAYKRLTKKEPTALETDGLYTGLAPMMTISLEAKETTLSLAGTTGWKPVPAKLFALHDNHKNAGKYNSKTAVIRLLLSKQLGFGSYTSEQELIKATENITEIHCQTYWIGEILSLFECNVISQKDYDLALEDAKEIKQEKAKLALERKAQRKELRLIQKVKDQQRKANSKLSPEDYSHMFEEETTSTLVGFL